MADNQTHITIHQLSESDRPREKALRSGIASLTDSELVALMIGSGNTEHTAIDIARILLGQYNNRIDLLSRASIGELQKIRGIGQARAVNIAAALEIGRRRISLEARQRIRTITSSDDACEILRPHMQDLTTEAAYVLLLDKANQVLDVVPLSAGNQGSTYVDVKNVVRLSLDAKAAAVILAHNHPSGNPSPSPDDIQITNRLRGALEIFDINLFDHVIVSVNAHYSFADEKQL